MTISYNLDVATASPCNLFRLLFRWKASIWKSCLKELCVWTTLYLIVTFIYRTPYFLSYEQKITFENIAHYLDTHLGYIPLTFMLGFFVQTIVKRWSVLFYNMGYVESPAIYIGGYVYGTDDECRILRRTMARYLCLTQLLVFRDISVRVRKRFPSYQSIVQAGFMLEHEKDKLESIRLNFDKYWVPINWIYALIFRARKEGKVPSDSFANKLCDEIKFYRYNIQMLCNYDWVPIPLAYPQLVFLAVYVYFTLCLIARQFIITDRNAPNKSEVDLTLPFMTMMEFVILVGWMKVAEGLLNPFGEDDDDFECNFLLDKNLATALCIVDDASNDLPTLQKDLFWHNTHMEPLYSRQSVLQPINPLVGSAIQAHIDTQQHSVMVRKSGDGSNRSLAGSICHRSKLASIAGRIQRVHRKSRASIHNVSLALQKGSDHRKPLHRQTSALPVLQTQTHIDCDISTIYNESFAQRSSDHGVVCHDAQQQDQAVSNVLSTVQEEDPSTLTVNKTEDSYRTPIDSLWSQSKSQHQRRLVLSNAAFSTAVDHEQVDDV